MKVGIEFEGESINDTVSKFIVDATNTMYTWPEFGQIGVVCEHKKGQNQNVGVWRWDTKNKDETYSIET